MEELVKKITAEFDAFATDAKLQVEKTTKQQVHVPAKALLIWKNY